MAKDFIHLHTHTHYSMLEGISKVPDLIAKAKKFKMSALAITDYGNMYGTIEFYQACKKADIKPIIGIDIFVAPRSIEDKTSADNKFYSITLLAKNEAGYKNLMRLVSIANTDGFHIKPRIDKKVLKKHADGLICLSGYFRGELKEMLTDKDTKKAEKVLVEYLDIFGKENYYIEIKRKLKDDEPTDIFERVINFAKENDVPLVATQNSHFLTSDDQQAFETVLAIQTGQRSGDVERLQLHDTNSWFIDKKTANEYFKEIPEALENTIKIADRCNLEIELGNWHFPNFVIPEGTTYDSEFKKIAYEGFEKRNTEKTKEAVERVEYELEVIKNKGYSSYFLIVADLLRHARKHHIYSTIRGSVAGSLVTYLSGITNVHPLDYKLPFERFLNPERPSAPDIDMDFADNRRDDVLDYAREKYGIHRVAQIGTFGKMLAKGGVRDVARALGHPYSVGDTIANLIPFGSQGFPMTIDRALKDEPDLKKLYQSDSDVKEIIDLAKKVEGCARHISVHAAGVVIAPTELNDFVPTQFDPKGGKLITQYDGHVIEDAGLIKFDFLGIRNLAILGDAVRLVKKFREIEIDIETIPVDNQKTFEMLARGETIGLFQLNGTGMTQYLKELKPTVIHDINAMVALYRPGPMESIPQYIERKYNSKLITYLDPRLKDILSMSYGVITYQDDVMMIAIKLAGYSWLEADKLRKAMGKKIPAVMEEQKIKLFKGFKEFGKLEDSVIKKLWSLIEPFAAYGFNKAHAASYGRVAYQTAYMKANYGPEYMTAVLTAEAGDNEKIHEIIEECKRMQIPVLPPDINESFEDFTVIKSYNDIESDKIRIGLSTIKNFGTDISEAIIAERTKNGKFKNYANFLERVLHKNMNKRSLESLIKVGAFDKLGERGQLLKNLPEALEYNKQIAREEVSDQNSLFSGMADKSTLPKFILKECEPAQHEVKLAWEKELLGLYLSGHPLDRWKEKIEKRGVNIKKIKAELHDGSETFVAGLIEECKEIMTKKGDRMAFLTISDLTDTMEMVVFPKTFGKYKQLLEIDNCVAIKGKVSERNDEITMIVDVMKRLK